MNGGFFVFRHEIFKYIQEAEELVNEPFRKLIAEKLLFTLQYDGFWSCMDTYKEKQVLEDMYAQGEAPWEVWKEPSVSRPSVTVQKIVGLNGDGQRKYVEYDK